MFSVKLRQVPLALRRRQELGALGEKKEPRGPIAIGARGQPFNVVLLFWRPGAIWETYGASYADWGRFGERLVGPDNRSVSGMSEGHARKGMGAAQRASAQPTVPNARANATHKQ